MFEIDYSKLAAWLLPVRLRQILQRAWVKALVSPITKVQEKFRGNRDANLYKLAHNGQTYSIENMLNDKFDSEDRRIYLSGPLDKERIYLFQPDDKKWIELGSIHVYNSGDYADTGKDFIVWVPNAISMAPQGLIKMSAELDFYKLAAKRYEIYRI